MLKEVHEKRRTSAGPRSFTLSLLRANVKLFTHKFTQLSTVLETRARKKGYSKGRPRPRTIFFPREKDCIDGQ